MGLLGRIAVARSLLIITALGLALASGRPASGSDIGMVKCSPNSDRVWVYESLNSFDVETRLKCGEPVEILSRVKGYVKIRTASGVEGYVPDAAFPDLPALPPEDADKPVASIAAAARPAAVHPVAATPSVAPAPSTAPPASPMVASKPAPETTNSAVAPSSTPGVAPVSAAIVQPPSATSPATNPAVARTSSASSVDVKPASAAIVPAQPRHVAKPATPTVVAEPAAPRKAPVKAAPPATQSAKATPSVSPWQPSPSNASVVSARASVEPVSATMMDTSAKASPAADITIIEPAGTAAESEDYPDSKPQNESADPACRVFFSAYGLAPAQYKWLVENRKKQYAEICPAPELSRVDYVILFAHDSDSYTDAMPANVHTDRNGFSDFNPVNTVDSALLSSSELDKARYEFVWVFRTKRGAFDPSRFSARRRPQFTTDAKGSHASSRAVEDAFHFIQTQGSPDR